MPEPKKPRLKEPVQLALIIAATLATGVPIFLAARDGRNPHGWMPWALVAMGVGSLLIGIFDREQKPDMKRINRANAIMFLLGPTGTRILFGAIGGAFGAGGLALVMRPG